MAIRFINKGQQRAEILLYGEVGPVFWGDEVSAKDFRDQLSALGDVDEIDLRINSYGGDVFEGIAIHRALVDHAASITTHIDGVAASIASVIAMAGKEIIIAESGMMMIHDAWTIAMGNATELRGVADRLEAASQAIADVYVARSGKTNAVIRGWMAEDKEFYGQAAVDAGLADKVAENLRLAARAKPDWEKVRQIIANRDRLEREKEGAANQSPASAPIQTEDDMRRRNVTARRVRFEQTVSGRA